MDLKDNSEFPHINKEPWEPPKTDLEVAKKILIQALKENKEEFGVGLDTISPENYYKQMVPYRNNNGERIIFVNGLCESFVKSPLPGEETTESGEIIGWKRHFYNVHDGGNCFWQAEINIDKKEYFHFSVNGQ
ncbi:MAG: hypothetical protein ACQEWG_16360 [Bacteroidota bacterium]